MGLILVFTAAWLVYFRREYIFPRALILIPVGLATMFALNVLRIATLMLIGYAGFPAVADFGFHSQAGWIAFIAAACGLVFFSHRSAWLNRTASRSTHHAAPENPTAAYLLPLLFILMAGVLSRAASSGFEFLYSLRLAAGAAMLYAYRRKFARDLDWRWSWWGPAVGAAVFVVWILGSHFLTAQATMPAELAMMAPPMRGIWFITRVAASVLVVPLAEEIAYRGFLMRRLKHPDFESVPFRSVGWPAIVISAVASGAAYGTLWVPGIAAGIAYGWLAVRRGSIADAVSAHAVTNALVAVSVLISGQWQLW